MGLGTLEKEQIAFAHRTSGQLLGLIQIVQCAGVTKLDIGCIGEHQQAGVAL